jgi:hypothetical protein
MLASIDRSKYLPIEELNHWPGILDSSLGFLRNSWRTQWIGLPEILKTCISELISLEDQSSQPIKELLECARQIAQNIEKFAPLSWEPSYHNRLHISDALTGLTVLMAIERERSGVLDAYWMSLLIFTVTAHDYLHPGGSNTVEFEIENKTLEALDAIWAYFPINEQSKAYIRHLIRHTDPMFVKQNHDLIKNQEFEFNLNWSTVLINESDVLASCSKKFGFDLSRQLAEEWRIKDLPLHSQVGTEQGRKIFLQSAIFSSPASHILKIDQSIQEEIQSLNSSIE